MYCGVGKWIYKSTNQQWKKHFLGTREELMTPEQREREGGVWSRAREREGMGLGRRTIQDEMEKKS